MLKRVGVLVVAAAVVAITLLAGAASAEAKRANPQVKSASVDPTTVAAGGNVDASATVANPHEKATNARHLLFRIFAADGSGSGRTLASLPIPKLKAGESLDLEAPLQLNPGKKPGAYEIVACRTPRKNTKRCGKSKASAPLTVVDSQLLTADPTSRNFGTHATGTKSAPETITFTNTGEAPTGALALKLAGGAAGQYEIGAESCSAEELAPGESCTAEVAFAPTSNGTKKATIVLSGSPGGSAAAALGGVGASPANLKITPGAKGYGTHATGTTASAQTFTVTNTGGVPTGTLDTGLGGTDASQFTVSADGCDGTTLAPGDSCTVDAAFGPTTTGAKSAALNVGGTPGGTASADLAGTGVDPAHLTISPISKSYGTAGYGTIGAYETFTVTNDGGVETGTIDTPQTGTNAGEFARDVDTCFGHTLGPGDTCTITIAFAPTSSGPKTSTVNAIATPGGTASADLDGTGVPPANLTVSPTSKAFADTIVGDDSSNQTFTFTNDGAVPTGTLGAASLSNSDADQFTIQQDLCGGQTLAPTGNCTVTVHFSPTSEGTKDASIDVGASPGGLAQAPLRGKGLAPADISVTPESWDFGSIEIDRISAGKTFTVTNSGDVAADTFVYNRFGTNAADFQIAGNTCPPAIPANSTCDITVEFSPGSAGSKSASLGVSAAGGLTDSSTLTGTGLTHANIVTSPDSLDFGNVLAGENSIEQTITIQNTGQSASSLTRSITGPNSTAFGLTSNSCGSILAAGASCTVTARFAAPGTTGTKNAAFTASAGSGSIDTTSLTGTSVATAANLQISQTLSSATSPGTYGSSASSQVNSLGYNSRKVWLKNTGEADAYISNSPVPLTGPADTTLDEGTCPIPYSDRQQTAINFTDLRLAGGAECWFILSAKGRVSGDWSVDFTIQASPGGSVSGNLFLDAP